MCRAGTRRPRGSRRKPNGLPLSVACTSGCRTRLRCARQRPARGCLWLTPSHMPARFARWAWHGLLSRRRLCLRGPWERRTPARHADRIVSSKSRRGRRRSQGLRPWGCLRPGSAESASHTSPGRSPGKEDVFTTWRAESPIQQTPRSPVVSGLQPLVAKNATLPGVCTPGWYGTRFQRYGNATLRTKRYRSATLAGVACG
jgi:hypothetical protein